jgi:hypothetical protein
MLFTIALCHILPETVEKYEIIHDKIESSDGSNNNKHGLPFVFILFNAGFLIMLFLD